MPLLSRFVLLGCVLAPAAHAQAPRALNAPPLPSVEADRLAAFGALLDGPGRGGTPDTTAPWRYYPLHVGDAWEYEDAFNGRITRRQVENSTIIQEEHYFHVREAIFEPDGTLFAEQVHPIRFDTLSSTVRWFIAGAETFYYRAPCPFDAPFYATVDCYGGVIPFLTEGGYDGVLMFEEGGEPDTLRGLSVKRYGSDSEFFSFVGDFGLVLYGGKGIENFALYYARVDGVEHGEPRYPTATEPPPALQGEAALSVWPNPAWGPVSLGLALARSADATLDVYDALGRRVLTSVLGLLPPGEHRRSLDLGALPPGHYLLRLRAATGERATRPVTVAR